MGQAISWAFAHTRLALELLLVAALLFGGWLYRRQERKLQASEDQHAQLAANLQEQIRIRDGEIQVLKRKGEKVVVQRIYIPVEAPITIDFPIPTPLNPHPQPIITLKTKGFCFRPGIGAELTGKGLQPRLDAKWGYWNRYSGLAGGTRYGVGVGVSRHIDDWLWFKPRNLEIFGAYNILRPAGLPPITIGVRSNF